MSERRLPLFSDPDTTSGTPQGVFLERGAVSVWRAALVVALGGMSVLAARYALKRTEGNCAPTRRTWPRPTARPTRF
jgi:hypothetical protein